MALLLSFLFAFGANAADSYPAYTPDEAMEYCKHLKIVTRAGVDDDMNRPFHSIDDLLGKEDELSLVNEREYHTRGSFMSVGRLAQTGGCTFREYTNPRSRIAASLTCKIAENVTNDSVFRETHRQLVELTRFCLEKEFETPVVHTVQRDEIKRTDSFLLKPEKMVVEMKRVSSRHKKTASLKLVCDVYR